MQLEGKRLIVTGGARGTGEATVLAAVREGAHVVSLDILNDLAEKVVAAANARGPGKASYRHCDVIDRLSVDAVFEDALAELGGLDALAMIAGDEQQIPVGDLTDELIEKGMRVHVKGTIYTNQAAFGTMRHTGGSIINYSSVAGVDGYPGMPMYSAAKGAVLGFSRGVARDWGKYGIRVNSVLPGVLSPLLEQTYNEMNAEQRVHIEAFWATKVLLGGKLGPPAVAADLNVFLASDASRFITGQTIAVDGGITFTR
jgi:NAD(P)-dependent dehydrogenase (short-subunit alcohol dehydrogenase family)